MEENLDNAFLHQNNNNIAPSIIDSKADVLLMNSIDKLNATPASASVVADRNSMDKDSNNVLTENSNHCTIASCENSSKRDQNLIDIHHSTNSIVHNNLSNNLIDASLRADDQQSQKLDIDFKCKEIELCADVYDVDQNTINDRLAASKRCSPSDDTSMMNNGKLKRNDNQQCEAKANGISEEKVTKKICTPDHIKSTVTNNKRSVNETFVKSDTSSNIKSSTSSSSIQEEVTTTNDKTNISFSDNTETESNSDQSDSEEDEEKLTEDESLSWDCSVCTFRNIPEAFKCQMCDVRKGMSTRKPRVNPKLLAQQVAKQQEQIQKEAIKAKEKVTIMKEKSKPNNSTENKRKTLDLEPMSPTSSTCSSKSIKREKKDKTPSKEENGLSNNVDKRTTTKSANFTFRLKDVDRNSAMTNSITVNNVTVMITEFAMKKPSDLENGNKLKNGKKTTPNKSK